MGGKRPDQYHSDNAGPGASDDRGARDEKIQAEQKEQYAENQAEMHREELIPKRGVNPALAAVQAKREAARAEALPGDDAGTASRKQRDDNLAS